MGGSKKVTIGYKYYLGMHLILCHGPIDLIRRIRCDKRIAWEGENTGTSVTLDKEGLFGGESREGGVSGIIDFDFGGPAQLQNDYLQSQLGTDIPAFRGVTSAIFRKAYLGMNPYLKFWDFRAQRIHITQDGNTQWYDEKAEIGTRLVDPLDTFEYRSASNTLPVSSIPISGWSTGTGSFGEVSVNNPFVPQYVINTSWVHDTGLWVRKTISCDGSQDIRIRGFVENSCHVYFDGVLIGSKNAANDDGAHGSWSFIVPRTTAYEGSHTVVIFALDDFEAYGDSDNTYLWFEVVSHSDMNPAHIIRECLTDPDWGMGYPTSDIDDTTFMAAADTLFDERMGISLLWEKQIPIEDFIKEIIRHINAVLYVDRVTGKFVLKLIRDDYDEETLLILDESNIQSVKDYARIDPGESINTVIVNYWDASTGETESVTADDLALIQDNGVVGTTIQYPGFTNPITSGQAAARDLKTFSSPLLSATITANREASGLNIGDTFKFGWTNFHDGYIVMRVMQMGYGNGKSNIIKIVATEDIYSLPESSQLGSELPGWEDPITDPEPSDYVAVVESMYYEMVQQLGQTAADDFLTSNNDIGYIVGTAGRPGSAINAVISVDAGAGYEDSTVVDFCPYGLLSADLDKITTSITLTNFQELDNVTLGTHAVLGSEIIVVTALNTLTGVATIGRGALDTTPQEHSAGDPVLFWDEYLESDTTEYVASDDIDIKIRPTTGAGTVELADVIAVNVVMNSRAFRPYPPGQFKLDGSYYPALVSSDAFNVTWVHRDRTQQTGGTLLDHTSASIGPEASTTYKIEIYNESDVLEQTISSISGTTQAVDLSGLPTEFATIKLYSVRDGYDSWMPAEHYFEFTIVTQFVVLPLTYDEVDYDATMTWTRQGDSPHVTPEGFEGDGWNARMTSDTIPTWMASASKRTMFHASLALKPGRVMNANTIGDIILFAGENTTGSTPIPKFSYSVKQDPALPYEPYASFLTHDGSVHQEIPLFRREWTFRGRYPELVHPVTGQHHHPQGIYFIDASTLLITTHFHDESSRCYRMNLSDWSITGYFDFNETTHPHVNAISRDSSGNYWFVGNNSLIRVNLTNSFASNVADVEIDYDVTAAGGSFLAIQTLGGTEYVLTGEYLESGTPYLYVFPLSIVSDAGTFAIGSRTIRYVINQRTQGIVHDGTDLYLSMNRLTSESGSFGYIHRNSIDPTGDTDGDSLVTPDASWVAPSQYPEDLSFHPSTGDLWLPTEGWDILGDNDGFLAVWSSPLDGSSAVNHVSTLYDGVGNFVVSINGLDFQTETWTPTQDVEIVSVGGPPQATAEFTTGFFKGYIKNIRFQNKDFSGTEYSDTIGGSTYEPNTLTEFSITMTNPGAEAGDTSGWTNETGSLGTRTANPDPYEGSYYFMGGANAATTARQRFNIETETGLTTTEIDAGGLWGKVRWHQASYTDQDPVTMGIRMLNGTPTQLSLDYAHKDWVQYGDSGATPNWQSLAIGVDIPSGARNIDAVYDASRTSGTNLDGYIDSISLTIYQQ